MPAIPLIDETTVLLHKQNQILKEMAQCLFNRLFFEATPQGRHIRDFNKFMVNAEKKLAANRAELIVLGKLRTTLDTNFDPMIQPNT